jgi:hypothetical protein
LERGRNLVLVLHGIQILHIFDPDRVPVFLDVFDPIATAASGGGAEDGEHRIAGFAAACRRVLRANGGAAASRRQQEEKADRE